MALTGDFYFMGNQYVVIQTSIKKNSQLYAVLSHKPQDDPYGDERSAWHYHQGATVTIPYVMGMIDVAFSESYGSTRLLEAIMKAISEVKSKAILSQHVVRTFNMETFENDDDYIVYTDGQLSEVHIVQQGMQLELKTNFRLNVPKRALSKLLKPQVQAEAVARLSFLDSTLESLMLRGFNFDWFLKDPEREYIELHTLEDVRTKFIDAFIREHKKWRKEPDFESFLMTMDFESTGLEAWCAYADNRDTAVFLGVSFQKKKAFGFFIDMANFPNIENLEELATILNNICVMDPLGDREITVVSSTGEPYTFMRSEIKTCAHNMLIDIRFGLTVGMDIWFDYCSMQIGFNADPFFTRGHNGVKDRVEQFCGIRYPDLGDIAGKGHEGRFRDLSDIRVVMMYGCSDVDHYRDFVMQLITGIRESKEYYGVDQIDQFTEIDMPYMNFKARFDYRGMRVDQEAALADYHPAVSKLNAYYYFMRTYVARVIAFKKFYDLYTTCLHAGRDVSQLEVPDLDSVKPYADVKWSGNFLLDVLFNVCQYPKLVMTKPSKKTLEQKKKFIPKPALDKDAIKYYLRFKALRKDKDIQKALETPQSLEDLKLKSMYLATDVINSETGEVIIEKDVFNSYRYPMFYVLQLIGPIEKSISADLEPIVDLKSPYRFAGSSMTSVVTRRDVSTLCTVSGDAKKYYLPYTPEMNLLDADQNSVEIRLAWGLSGDENLIAPLNDPERDPHTEACAEFFDKPAYLVDKKKERKPIKYINFGRIYLREVYSCCMQIHDGDMSAENLAHTAYLLDLFDEKRAPVHAGLNLYRDDLWQVRDIPPFLRRFLKMDPDKKYGRMTNLFHWTQHCEIREDDPWYEAFMKRKAGNFCVQGLASTLLRILWVRAVKEFWRRGWIQDGRVLPHLTIYDEIVMSYHNSLNPVDVVLVIRDAFLVQYKNFPKLFVGVNVVDTWGEGKEDKHEIPVYLIERLKRDRAQGKYEQLPDKSHKEFFLDVIVEYKRDRIREELLKLNNKNKKLWHIESLSEKFENYSVRSLLIEHNKGIFDIKDYYDPIECLFSVLTYFVSQEMLHDDEIAVIGCRGKSVTVNKDSYKTKYASEEDFFIGKDKVIVSKPDESFSQVDYDNTIDFEQDFSFEEESESPLISDEEGFTRSPSFDEGDLNSWDASFMKNYFVPEGSVDQDGRVISIEEYMRDKEVVHITFDNFRILNNKTTIRCDTMAEVNALVKMSRTMQTTSLNSYKVFVSNLGTYTISIGSMKEGSLRILDKWITERKKNLAALSKH